MRAFSLVAAVCIAGVFAHSHAGAHGLAAGSHALGKREGLLDLGDMTDMTKVTDVTKELNLGLKKRSSKSSTSEGKVDLELKAAIKSMTQIEKEIKELKKSGGSTKKYEAKADAMYEAVVALEASLKSIHKHSRRDLASRHYTDSLRDTVTQLLIIVAGIINELEDITGNALPFLKPLYFKLNPALSGLLGVLNKFQSDIFDAVCNLLIGIQNIPVLNVLTGPLGDGVGRLLFGAGVLTDHLLGGHTPDDLPSNFPGDLVHGVTGTGSLLGGGGSIL